MVNKNLRTKTEFNSYTEVIDHLCDCTSAVNMKIVNWDSFPPLITKQPLRFQLSIEGLDKVGILVVYFCQLEKHIECIAHYKEN